MSQIEARINALRQGLNNDVEGNGAFVEVDDATSAADEFPIYYGLLANAHGWRHANPQNGLEMNALRPLVYEMLYNIGDNSYATAGGDSGLLTGAKAPAKDGSAMSLVVSGIRGNAKPLPFINCTAYSGNTGASPGFPATNAGGAQILPTANEHDVPWINCVVGAIIVPPSRLHELFYRMVVEWTIEFSQIRPIGEITNWTGLGVLGDMTHYQNYSFESTKKALGVEGEVMDHDQTMVSANVDINKVM